MSFFCGSLGYTRPNSPKVTCKIRNTNLREKKTLLRTGDSGETDGFWPSLTSMSKEEMQKILKALPSEELVQLAKELDLMAHMGDAPWRFMSCFCCDFVEQDEGR